MLVKVQETRINLDHVQYYTVDRYQSSSAIIFKMTNGNVRTFQFNTKAELDEALQELDVLTVIHIIRNEKV